MTEYIVRQWRTTIIPSNILGSTASAFDNLIRLANKIADKSEGIACELYQLILEKMTTADCPKLSKAELQYSFGKYLVKIEDYGQANEILKDALRYSEENDVSKNIARMFALIFIPSSFLSLSASPKKYAKYTTNPFTICRWIWGRLIQNWQPNWRMTLKTLQWKVFILMT